MALLLWPGIFLVSLVILIKASNYFTDAAARIGLHFGIPKFIVGVTVVGIGTSLPELVSSIIAVFENSSEIVAGNVVGSNITNIFLVLGVTAIVGRKIQIDYSLIHVDLPLLVGSSFFLLIVMWDGHYLLPEALLSFAGVILYLTFAVKNGQENHDDSLHQDLKWYTWLVLAGSSVFIFLGAKYTVESVIKLAEMLHLGKEIVAASAVALGTSLPELAVSVSAAKKGQAEMAIGNILGSNIFNALGVMSIPALFGTLIIPPSILDFALPVMVLATLLYMFSTQDKQITRWEGWMLIGFYILFIGKLFKQF